MVIAIEAQRIFRKNKHGMDFVALECIKELQKIDKENEYYIFTSDGEDECLSETQNFHIVKLKSLPYPIWEQFLLPKAVKKVNAAVLHCTSNTAPIFCKTPIIITLHDIIFLEKKRGINKSLYQNMGWYYRKLIVPIVLKKCLHIITVSDYECSHIKKELNIKEDKISFIYNGYNSHFQHYNNFLEITGKYFSENKYLFFLGNTDPKKNCVRVIKGYSIYFHKTPNPIPLIIADLNKNIISSILSQIGMEILSDHIKPLGYVPNKDLPAIYSGAVAFIYASLRESFGIPILESMACGTPVITSDTSAMPEIGGDAAIKIDPYKEEEIADAIIKVTSDDQLRKDLIEKGYKRVANFSWNNTAKETLNLYKQLLQK